MPCNLLFCPAHVARNGTGRDPQVLASAQNGSIDGCMERERHKDRKLKVAGGKSDADADEGKNIKL